MPFITSPNVSSITKTGGSTTYGAVTVTAGSNITITQSGQDFSFAASGGGSMSIGGTVTSGTTGSVLFVGAGPVLAQDNATFFWDTTNKRLGIGTTSPAGVLSVTKSTANLFQGVVNTFTSTGFTNAGATIPNPIISNTINLTEAVEASTDGGTIVSNTLNLNFGSVNSSAPGTNILYGFNNTINLTQANGVTTPDTTNVAYNMNITNTGGGSNTYVRNIEFTLTVMGAFQQNSYAALVFRSPVLDVGATINTQNCILIEDQGSTPALVMQGSGDSVRIAGSIKVGANSAITSGMKLEVVGVAKVSTGISLAGTNTAATTAQPLMISGQAAREIFMQRETTSNTAGNTLTITSSGATSGATNKSAGSLILQSGISTGSGTGTIIFKTSPGTAGSTSDNTVTTALTINGSQNLDMVGKVSTYNNIATVSGGVPSELATVDLATQAAAITDTTLYTPAATGLFRVSIYLQVTRAATTSSILGGATGVVIKYTDGDGSVAQANTAALATTAGAIAVTAAGNTTATNLEGTLVIYAKTGVAITYAIGYTSVGVTTMQYAAHLKVEAL